MCPEPVQAANTQSAILFYDGHCALCHGAVKFVLKHDRSGDAFRFAPLQGETFRARVAEGVRATLPDSIAVLTEQGALLVRSDAFLYILTRLGGRWKFASVVLRAGPHALRDMMYDFVARVRYRVFGTRTDLCPVVPPELRSRFDP
ncbi:MAG: thiol-disulfide oxidoreductase DCC family protein [Candidatus Acidiferrales bacterium]